MLPVLFHFGPVSLDSYGLFMALGFLAADRVIAIQSRERGLRRQFTASLMLWIVIGALPCARLAYIFENWKWFRNDPLSMIFNVSGWVWYGGLFGGLLALWAVSIRNRIPFLLIADVCAPALVLGEAVARIGCFTSGDGDWGVPTTMPWGVSFPKAAVGWNPGTVLTLGPHRELVSGYFSGVRVHPTMLYESILGMAVFLALWLSRRNACHGRTLSLYLILAGTARFVVEFWRINPRVLWAFSEAQIISALLVCLGAAVLVFTSSSHRPPAQDCADSFASSVDRGEPSPSLLSKINLRWSPSARRLT